MIINGIEYGFTILPYFNKVKAEIYQTHNTIILAGQKMQTEVLCKDFGSVFRKPIELDYIKAKKWAEEQMKYIMDANS
jgi:hypothetical protein